MEGPDGERVRRYEAVVVGAGQAGVPLCRRLAGAGWPTLLVERQHIGGTCVNEGCTPSKTMAASARNAYLARRAGDYGVQTGPVGVDMRAVRERKRHLVDEWRAGDEKRLASTPGLDVIRGQARFAGPHTLIVSRPDGPPLQVEAAHIFINTGCRPAVPDLPGLDAVPYLTSTSIMELDAVPTHLLVLGGGYVGVEFAQMFRRFGAQVTIVQRRSSLLPREDDDVTESLTGILREDGIEVILDARARSAGRGAPAAALVLDITTPAGERTLAGSHLLVATGRTPNTDDLDVQAAGLELDDKGYLPADERLQTKVPGIYALGDVRGGPAFTHISYDDYRIVAADLLEGGSRTTADRPIPYVIFSDPQLGRVGLTETQAKERSRDIEVYRMPMAQAARALETGETRGLMKAVVEAETGRILGCAILGIDGGEVMAMVELAMMGGLTARQLRDVVFAHPTLAEALNTLFSQ